MLANETTELADNTKKLLQVVGETAEQAYTDAAKAVSEAESYNISNIRINFSEDSLTKTQEEVKNSRKDAEAVINEGNETKKKVNQVILKAKNLIDFLEKEAQVCIYN